MACKEIIERLAGALQAALDTIDTTEAGSWTEEAEEILADVRAGHWQKEWDQLQAQATSIPTDLPAVTRAAQKLYIAAVVAVDILQDIRLNSVLEAYFTEEEDWEKSDEDWEEEEEEIGEHLDERPRTKSQVIGRFTRAVEECSTYTLENERMGTGTEVLQVLEIAISAYNGSLMSRKSEGIEAIGDRAENSLYS